MAKSASIKMRLLQADGKLVSFALIVNFTDDIELLNLLSFIHLNFHRSSNQRCILQNFSRSVFSAIAFLDSALRDGQTLRNGIELGTEVITLDRVRDGVEQITEALASRSNIKSIHIISHGRPASL